MAEVMEWNGAQISAIDARSKGIVVSAAAGSGKTAVLVQRIINRICDENDPASFERLLVVTFTRAAAGEMNQRLRSKLNEVIADNPGNMHLQRQKRLLSLATISSIDSFFYSLVRDNFHRLNVTPDFRILESGERRHLIEDSLNETADEFYELNSPEFTELTDIIGNDKNDDSLFDIVKKLNNYADSHVSPDKWLDSLITPYDSELDVGDTEIGAMLLEHISDSAKYALSMLDKAIGGVEGFEGLKAIYDLLIREREIAQDVFKLASERNWDALKIRLDEINSMSYARFPTNSVCEDLRSCSEFTAAKALRSRAKDVVKALPEIICVDSAQYRQDLKRLLPVVKELVHFVKEYRRIYSEKKALINAFDFDDITHLAIKLLINEDGTRTDIAQEISSRYDEILIDEYQDTNEAQDAIFKAISDGLKNLFLVGDVKQSVYGFRLATPFMFIEKITQWKKKEVEYADYINLDKNYRSRQTVLACVNYLFRKAMSRKVGDIEYNENEELKYGAKYPEGDPSVEIDIVSRPRQSDRMPETLFVAKRIQRLLDGGQVYDLKKKAWRPMRLRDICVLCRTNKSCEKYAAALNNYGIPTYHNARNGFFECAEIRTMLSLLEILDNPIQDVPLLSVLVSPMFGFSADELAKLRVDFPKGKLYYAVLGSDSEKCRDFVRHYNELRCLSGVLALSALIREIYERTGYYAVAGALTNGSYRQMNLMLLLDYATAYEQNSKSGLSGFVRYLERCSESDSELESAASVPENADVVQVMTIHKSKGLEFPIVILSDMATPPRSYGNKLAIDETLGAGLKICEKERFMSYPSVQYIAANLMKSRREFSEELRLLYVAMTRAKEKLIITAEFQNVPDRLSKYGYNGLLDELNPVEVVGSGAFINLIMKAFIRHRDCGEIRKHSGLDIKADSENDFNIEFNIIDEPCEEAVEKPREITRAAADAQTVEIIRKKADYEYPYRHLSKLATKKSASSFNEDSDTAVEFFASQKPSFAADGSMTGAQKGTAMHRFMEVCDFSLAEKDLEAELDRVVELNLLTREQGDALDVEAIRRFFESDVYRRMRNSEKVMREQKFTVFVPASFVDDELDGAEADEKVLVQGVIDCAFYENGKIVVLDYKTDRVKSGDELALMYHRQLEVYKLAAQQSFNCEVSELLLYSFRLGCEVRLG